MLTAGAAHAGTAVTSLSLINMPPGPCTVLLANAGTVTAFTGPGTNVTTGNGFPVPSGAVPPVVVPVYAGSAGETWSCCTASGSATLAWIVSSPAGGTGP